MYKRQGKGFAIGSAALTALALMAAYLEEVRVGFDRWADKQDCVASASLDDAEVVKLSRSAMAVKVPGSESNEAYLVFPAGGRKSALLEEFHEAEVGASVPNVDLTALIDQNQVVQNASATMPDYSRYYDFSLMNPKVLVGMFLGCLLYTSPSPRD